MRSFWKLSAVAFIGVLVAVTGIHGLGTLREEPIFPLPGANGCWDGLCFADFDGIQRLPRRLNETPRIVPGSAQWVGAQTPGYVLIEFQYRVRQDDPRPVLLFWNLPGYNLARDWRSTDSPPLMRLGDLLAMLGPPVRISLLSNQVVLHYPARRLRVTLLPSARHRERIYLSAANPVIGVNTPNPGYEMYTRDAYYPYSWDWHGFGSYYPDS